GRTFDLAICLEVAEHLPETAATALVASLASLAPIVLFSAAIPFQGGTDHRNEQWPQYWFDRFAVHHYVAIDCLRPHLWNKAEVDVCYAQNAVLLAREDALAAFPALSGFYASGPPRALVHPALYLGHVD